MISNVQTLGTWVTDLCQSSKNVHAVPKYLYPCTKCKL